MSLTAMITAEMTTVAQEQGKSLQALRPETPLLETGLDSLCFAILVARLEDKLGVDPFTAADDAYFPVTVGDLVRLYETAKTVA